MKKKVELKFPVLVIFETSTPTVCYSSHQLKEFIDKEAYGDFGDAVDDATFYPVDINTDGRIEIGDEIYGVEAEASYTFVIG